jgi:hypothetical protein
MNEKLLQEILSLRSKATYWLQWSYFRQASGRCLIPIANILTDAFPTFPKSLRASAKVIPQISLQKLPFTLQLCAAFTGQFHFQWRWFPQSKHELSQVVYGLKGFKGSNATKQKRREGAIKTKLAITTEITAALRCRYKALISFHTISLLTL